jgi:putative glutamine amidotransferase
MLKQHITAQDVPRKAVQDVISAWNRARQRAIRPLIGIPTFLDTTLPEKMPQRFAMSRPYIQALEAAGAAVMLIPLDLQTATMEAIFDRLDGLFLAGGGDVAPAWYAAQPHEKTEGIDTLRDAAEMQYARWALELGKPIFGVCRGIQTLNVAAGGTLIQDIETFVPRAIRHQYYPEFPREYVAHPVETSGGSRLARIVGGGARVNSFHHQAVDRVAADFTICARAEDGVVEAIERPGEVFVVGVQWHPESLVETDPAMAALFSSFVQAATEQAA